MKVAPIFLVSRIRDKPHNSTPGLIAQNEKCRLNLLAVFQNTDADARDAADAGRRLMKDDADAQGRRLRPRHADDARQGRA